MLIKKLRLDMYLWELNVDSYSPGLTPAQARDQGTYVGGVIPQLPQNGGSWCFWIHLMSCILSTVRIPSMACLEARRLSIPKKCLREEETKIILRILEVMPQLCLSFGMTSRSQDALCLATVDY